MSDFQRVDPKGWEYDLHSVYSAYLGHFQLHNIPWYERSWGHLFETFEEFLKYSWSVIVITDVNTGKAHIVTRMSTVAAFVKMVKTRFGDTLPPVTNMLPVNALETSSRRVHNISDWTTYKKLHSTLPAAVLAALKSRVKGGDPSAITPLWAQKQKTFMALDFEWSERNSNTLLEWGYAAVRCGHLVTAGSWPPDPETNYRQGHYAIEDYVHQQHNKIVPNKPWQYAFGETQRISKTKSPVILQAIISSLATPDSETLENNLVLVGHGIQANVQRMEEMKIKIPHNVLIIDLALYERQLYANGARSPMLDSRTGAVRDAGSTLSLSNIIRSMGVDIRATLHNAGNDAFLTLLALQMLLDPKRTVVPSAAGLTSPTRAQAPTIQFPAGNAGILNGMFTTVPSPSSPAHLTGFNITNPTPLPQGMNASMGMNGGYFDPSRVGSRNARNSLGSSAQPRGTANRGSRPLSGLVPDEMGTMPARSSSADRLSKSMRGLSMG